MVKRRTTNVDRGSRAPPILTVGGEHVPALSLEVVHPLDCYTTAPRSDASPDCADQLRAHFRLAEEHGFTGSLIFYGHNTLDPWSVASVMLHHTERLVPLVAVQPNAYPPHTTAKMLASLTLLHDRRIDLNLVTGAAANELAQLGDAIDHDERYLRLGEYAEVLDAFIASPSPVHHKGRFYEYSGAQMHTALHERVRPRVFVAGASEASRTLAAKLGATSVTHPVPVSQFEAAPTDLAGPVGIRIGVLARPTADAARAEAEGRYVLSRESSIRTLKRTTSESVWARNIAELAVARESYDEVYWTTAFRSGAASYPMLVGTYEQVSSYLKEYLDLGVSSIILAGMQTEEEFRHFDQVRKAIEA